MLLHRATGEVTYVNAGHNPPMIAGSASVQLEATGVPLGLFPEATYEARIDRPTAWSDPAACTRTG